MTASIFASPITRIGGSIHPLGREELLEVAEFQGICGAGIKPGQRHEDEMARPRDQIEINASIPVEPVRRITYTHNEMAESLGVSPRQLARLVNDGLPRITISGRPLYNPVRVLEWLEAQPSEAKNDGSNADNPTGG